MTVDREALAAALPGYRIGDQIGAGGFASVVRATHLALGRDVAVKQLGAAMAADAEVRQRFVNEARTIAGLDHPHVVKIFDFVEHADEWFIVMEYLPGATLEDRSRSPMSLADALAAGLAVCSGLQAAHAKGVLHRDVKPANVLFTETDVPRLGDFGVAKVATPDGAGDITMTGHSIGTPRYMAPEIVRGDPVGPAADVYSTAIMLYLLIAGRSPYAAPSVESPTSLMLQHVTDAAEPLHQVVTEVHPALSDAIQLGLAKDPADRFSTPEAFGVALATAGRRSLGSGWLSSTSTKILASGPIVDAAYDRGTSGAPPTAPVTAISTDTVVSPHTPAPTTPPPTIPPQPDRTVAATPTPAPAPPPPPPDRTVVDTPPPAPSPYAAPPPAAPAPPAKRSPAAFIAVGAFLFFAVLAATYFLTRDDPSDPVDAGNTTTTAEQPTSTEATTPTSEPPPETSEPTAPPTTVVPAGFTSLPGQTYDLLYPSDWTVVAHEEQKDGYVDTTITSNDLLFRVNHTPDVDFDTGRESAQPIIDTLRTRSDYEELRVEDITFTSASGTYENALVWEYIRSSGGVPLRNFSVYWVADGTSMAIRTAAPVDVFESVSGLLRDLRASVSLR